MSSAPRFYTFGSFRLDIQAGALLRDGQRLDIRPKTFDTLTYLLANQGRLVSKTELLDELWSEAFVTDDVLVQSIADIRRILGDDARNPRYVKTVPRRGYIFIHEVFIEPTDPPARSVAVNEAARQTAVEGDYRSARNWFWAVAVLLGLVLAAVTVNYYSSNPVVADPEPPKTTLIIEPFEIRADEPGYQWLSQGLPNLIRAGMWHSGQLTILPPRRSVGALPQRQDQTASQQEESVLTSARRSGAQRMISGSLVKLGDGFQVNASLVDLIGSRGTAQFSLRATGARELFAVIDSLCLEILQTLAFEKGLHAVEGPLLAESITNSLLAYQHYIEGLQYAFQGGARGARLAEKEFREAIQIDPEFAMAHFNLAQVQKWASSWGYRTVDPAETLRQASRFDDRMPEMEQLLFAGMRSWIMDSEPDAALAFWAQLEARFPVFSAEARLPIMTAEILLEDLADPKSTLRYGESHLSDPYLTDDARARLSALLASASRQLGDQKKALEYRLQSVQLWPFQQGQIYLLHLVDLGRAHLELGERERALRLFDDVRSIGEGDEVHLTNAAWGFYMAGDKERALRTATRARQINPRYGNVSHLLGWLAMRQGEYLQAAERFTAAFRETPAQFGSTTDGMLGGDLAALYYSAVAFQKAGQPEAGAMAFEELLNRTVHIKRTWAHRPSSFPYQQALALEVLAYQRLDQGEQGRALQSEFAEPSDNYDNWCLLRARIEAVSGNSETALEWVRKAVAAGSTQFQHTYDNPDFDSLRDQLTLEKLRPTAE